MSIRQRQIDNETHRVLMKELKEGRYPDLSYIQNLVNSAFVEKVAGQPRFEPYIVSQKEISSSEKYNKMIEGIHEDLSVAFDEVRYHGDRMMALANYYDTEKEKMNTELRNLGRRMEIIREKLKERGKRQIVYDTFNDFLMIDFYGNSKRGVPETDAFVDLRLGAALLQSVDSEHDEVSLDNAETLVEPQSSFLSFEELTPVSNALKDTINESWRHKGIMETASPCSAIVTIRLKEPANVNTISYVPQSPRPIRITPTISSDGIDYRQLKTKSSTYLTEWNFEEQAVSHVAFLLEKDEPDFVNGTEYHYYFGAESISLHRFEFLQECRVVSKEHVIDGVVDKVTIEVDETIPPGTNIQYFIAEDNPKTRMTEWELTTPGVPNILDTLKQEYEELTPSLASYGTYFGTKYGQDFYRISSLKYFPIKRSAELLMGVEMFQVESKSVPSGEDYKGNLASWKRIKRPTTKYINMNNITPTAHKSVPAGSLEKLTTFIEMDRDYILQANPFDYTGDIDMTVYVNNMVSRPLKGTYTYNLKKGFNKIEFIIYSENGGTICPNLSPVYLESLGALGIYAQKDKLRQVGLYDLLHNTSKSDLTRYAIDDSRNVIVNYNPKVLDVDGVGVPYELRYRHPKDPNKTETRLRFMAVLMRDDGRSDVTPILSSYKMIIE